MTLNTLVCHFFFQVEDVDEPEEPKGSQEDDSIENDKMIKQAGAKAKKATTADTKGKGKASGGAKGKK